MAQIKFSDVKESSNSNGKVGFFNLVNDGDTAVVRIMQSSPDDFEIVSVHQATVNGKFRKINCLRSTNDPVEACPICVAEKNYNATVTDKNKRKFATNRIYIHMIQYTRDEHDNIVASPVIWDRPAQKFGKKLVNLMNEWGDLNNVIVKVTRNGAKGSNDTDYDLIVPNQAMYPEDVYVKMPDAFKDYSVLSGTVISRGYDDLDYFVHTGTFPQNVQNQNNVGSWNPPTNNAPNTGAPSVAQTNAPTQTFQSAPVQSAPAQNFPTNNGFGEEGIPFEDATDIPFGGNSGMPFGNSSATAPNWGAGSANVIQRPVRV